MCWLYSSRSRHSNPLSTVHRVMLIASMIAESRPSSPGIRSRRSGKAQDDESEEVQAEKEGLLEKEEPISDLAKTPSLWTALWTLKLPLYHFNVISALMVFQSARLLKCIMKERAGLFAR